MTRSNLNEKVLGTCDRQCTLNMVSQTGSNLQSAQSSVGCFNQAIASFFDLDLDFIPVQVNETLSKDRRNGRRDSILIRDAIPILGWLDDWMGYVGE